MTMLITGLLIGYLWGTVICSNFGVVARYEEALKEIADWENYNSGGDIKYGCRHPAKVAEDALGKS